MAAGRRLFIVDPSLTDIRGHHYTLTRNITESAGPLALDVRWLSSADVSPDLLSRTELCPTFQQSMYTAYQQSAAGQASRLDALRRRLARISPRLAPPEKSQGAPAGPDFDAIRDSIAEGLRQAIAEHGIGPADRLLFHTADGATYLALADLIGGMPSHSVPLIHVCTPYDPVGVMPNRKDPDEVKAAVRSFVDAGLVDRKVFLYGENPFLAEHLSDIWDVPVRPLDLPMVPVDEPMKFLARQYRADTLGLDEKTFMITTLGAARMEKGFHLIPDIIRRTFEFAGTPQYPNARPERIKFVLQASAQIIGRHPVIAAAIEKLQQMPQTQVELLLQPLSDLDYRNLLVGSDAVLMPYDEAAYRVRGSGVVTEAIVARKFIVSKSGSYPAMMADWQGGASGDTPLEMARQLLSIINQRWERFDAVREASVRYLEANDVRSYVPKLIAAERSRMSSTKVSGADYFRKSVRQD